MATATRLDLEAFVATEYPRVVAAVRLITGDRDGAADAVQDALVALLGNPPEREPDNTALGNGVLPLQAVSALSLLAA